MVRVVPLSPGSYEFDLYYDANDRLVRRDTKNVDELGAVRPNAYISRQYGYDDIGRLTRQRAEVAPGVCVTREFEWDANGDLTLMRNGEAVNGNRPANVVRLLPDERRLLFERIDAEGNPADASTESYSYDAAGRLTKVARGLEDPAGPDVTAYQYDGYGRLTQRVDAEGNETTWHYDAKGNATSVRLDGEEIEGQTGVNVRLYEGAYTYDEVNRPVQSDIEHFVVSTGAPIGDGLATNKAFYDSDSRPVRFEDDHGHATTYLYDTAGRPTKATDPAGDTTTFSYDAAGRVTLATEVEQSDLGGLAPIFPTSYEYDALGRVTALVESHGGRWEASYDSLDVATSSRDALGNASRYSYDGLGRLTKVARDLTDTGTGAGTVTGTVVTEQTWDDSSRLTSYTDANGNTTLYGYDDIDRLTQLTAADGTEYTLDWGWQGDLEGVVDANGSVQANAHDRMGRLVSRSVSAVPGVIDTGDEIYRYDGMSRLVRAEDGDSVVTRAHDSLSNPLQRTQQVGGGPVHAVGATYDGEGNLTSLSYPSGSSVLYTYDALERPKLVLSGDGSDLVASYDWAGPRRVARISRPNGVVTNYGYDSARRMLSATHSKALQTLAQHVFGWNAAHDKTSWQDTLAGVTVGFEHDSLHRLAGSTRAEGGSDSSIDYQLDAAGNRVLVAGGPEAGSYVMDPTLPEPADLQVDQYTTTPRGGRTYDRNGATLTLDAGPEGGLSLAYDTRNQMAQASIGSEVETTYSYAYDASGRRVQRSVSGQLGSETWVHAGSSTLERLTCFGGTCSPQATFVHGARGALLQMKEATDLNGNSVLDTYDYHTDDLGSVVAVTNASGAVVERYRYDDFANPRFFNGAGAPIPGSAISNPYLFRGVERDPETGLYRAHAGAFDPHAGRVLAFTCRPGPSIPPQPIPMEGWLGSADSAGDRRTSPLPCPPAFIACDSDPTNGCETSDSFCGTTHGFSRRVLAFTWPGPSIPPQPIPMEGWLGSAWRPHMSLGSDYGPHDGMSLEDR